jgi:hypothetical protein
LEGIDCDLDEILYQHLLERTEGNREKQFRIASTLAEVQTENLTNIDFKALPIEQPLQLLFLSIIR